VEESALVITRPAPPRLPQAPGVLSIASVTEVVYQHLRLRILSGMTPGQPLRLNDVAAELGVSTTPVRMAIERLAGDGLVLHAGRKGASVAPLSLSDFQDIYAVRRGLEGTAARLGAGALTDSDISRMRLGLRRLDQIAASHKLQLDVYLEVEWEMHETCYRAAAHQRLLREIQAYRRQAERYFRLALHEGVNVRDDLEHQHHFFDACAERDPDRAETVAQLLLDWTVERVAPLIRNLPGTQEGPG
jgi:DNA-binding GntR family transcriptional regulator